MYSSAARVSKKGLLQHAYWLQVDKPSKFYFAIPAIESLKIYDLNKFKDKFELS
jgi:hypothetical protein